MELSGISTLCVEIAMVKCGVYGNLIAMEKPSEMPSR